MANAETLMTRPIQLNLDLTVDPAREAEMVHYFETVFRPAAMAFSGYIDLKLLKLMGPPPPGVVYRFSLRYESEALRQKWVTSDVHTRVWGALETYLTSNDYTILLFDVI
jgi:hypothetical protein